MVHLFFDIDGCILDYGYRYTTPLEKLRGSINIAKNKGAIFSINSNRSIESMLKVYNELGLNGVLIGENGVFAYNPFTGEELQTGFPKMNREFLVSALREMFPVVEFINTDTLVKNPATFVDRFKGSPQAAFCEETRRYTMTVYPRMLNDEGTIAYSQDLLQKIGSDIAVRMQGYSLEIGGDYGNILLVPTGSNKGSLLNKIAEGDKIVSFGDGIGDISMFEVSDFCGVPANAKDSVKGAVQALGGIVTTNTFSEGVYEFIEKVIKRYNL